MDRHGAQMTVDFQECMTNKRVQPAYTPADCTDCIAPVDHHVTNALKHIISGFYHQDLEDNLDHWCNPVGQGGLEAWQRRVKMATWVAVAWTLLREDAAFLRSSFVSTGWLIAQDGSENHLPKIPGVPNYDFTCD